MSTSRMARLTDAVLLVACIAMVGAFARRQYLTPQRANISEQPEYFRNWNDLLPAGIRYGSANPKLTIIEFADLECSFCKRLDPRLDAIVKEHEGEVAVVMLHYPLPMHRFALPAARALECASEKGRAREFARAVYAKQDSLGLKTWAAYAVDAGILDTSGFAQCAIQTNAFPRIEAGTRLGKRIGIRGTPTILVNGWRLPADDELENAIRKIKLGRSPVTGPHAERTF